MDSNRFIGNIMDTKVLKPSFTALVKDFTLGLQNVFDNENLRFLRLYYEYTLFYKNNFIRTTRLEFGQKLRTT